MRVSLLVTCLVDLFTPDVGLAVVGLLRRHGVAVDFPRGQTCCGLPLYNSGYHKEAAGIARHMILQFSGAEAVVVPSGSCAWMVRQEYPHLFADDPEMAGRATALAQRTYELSQFLVEILKVERVDSPFKGKVTYHDSCHLLRGLGVKDSPRKLLCACPGVELLELPGADECCGFGGSFAVRLPEISDGILRQKIKNIRSTGADAVVACDSGCLLQLSGGLSRRGEPVRALHLAQVLFCQEGRVPTTPPPGPPPPG